MQHSSTGQWSGKIHSDFDFEIFTPSQLSIMDINFLHDSHRGPNFLPGFLSHARQWEVIHTDPKRHMLELYLHWGSETIKLCQSNQISIKDPWSTLQNSYFITLFLKLCNEHITTNNLKGYSAYWAPYPYQRSPKIIFRNYTIRQQFTY
jgi:hypothetical protein